MAAYTDPRFSDSEERSAEQRVDEAYERSGIVGIGLGALVALALVMGFVLFAAVTELGHLTGPTRRRWLTGRLINRRPEHL